MTKRCPACQLSYPDAFDFCNKDGTALLLESSDKPGGETKAKLDSGNRWARRTGEFAVRIEVRDLKSLLGKGLVIEEGIQGILLQNGKLVGTVEPGYHTVQTVSQRLQGLVVNLSTTVVLWEKGASNVVVAVPQLITGDDQAVDGLADIIIAVQSPLDFFTSVMKGRMCVSVTDIANRLRPWVREVLEAILVDSLADELHGNAELRGRIELDLRQRLNDRLRQLGLVLVGVDAIQFADPTTTEVRRRRGELNRDKALAEIDLAYEAFQEELAKDASSRQMAQIESDAEFAQFLQRVEHDVFRRDLLRQQDRDELIRQYRERTEDQDGKRAHLLAMVELQRRQERARLACEFRQEELRREHELAVSSVRQRMELSELARREEQTRLDEELAARLHREEAECFLRNKREREAFDWDLHRKQAAARLDLHLAAEKQSQEFANARAAIELYHDYKAAKQQRDHFDRHSAQALQIQAESEQHRREMERAARLNELAPETLLAIVPARQAELLAELIKIKANQRAGGIVCNACGQTTLENARYCHACGKPFESDLA